MELVERLDVESVQGGDAPCIRASACSRDKVHDWLVETTHLVDVRVRSFTSCVSMQTARSRTKWSASIHKEGMVECSRDAGDNKSSVFTNKPALVQPGSRHNVSSALSSMRDR